VTGVFCDNVALVTNYKGVKLTSYRWEGLCWGNKVVLNGSRLCKEFNIPIKLAIHLGYHHHLYHNQYRNDNLSHTVYLVIFAWELTRVNCEDNFPWTAKSFWSTLLTVIFFVWWNKRQLVNPNILSVGFLLYFSCLGLYFRYTFILNPYLPIST
jgi:hypothetical protein